MTGLQVSRFDPASANVVNLNAVDCLRFRHFHPVVCAMQNVFSIGKHSNCSGFRSDLYGIHKRIGIRESAIGYGQ
jgi:hypothetical protein